MKKKMLAVLLTASCVCSTVGNVPVYGAELQNTNTGNVTLSQELTYEDKDADVDDADDDGDGLINYWEEVMGTDKNNADTDGDGVNDYEEVYTLGTDPLMKDTLEDGVSDGKEDTDGDGIKDAKEVELGTNPFMEDTDGDGLTDGEEVKKYGTDPLASDSDLDGANDGFEVENGFDPMSADKSFTLTVTSKDGNCSLAFTAEGAVAQSVAIVSSGSYTEEASIGAVSEIYQVQAAGTFEQGVLSFTTDAEKTHKPTIYAYEQENETKKLNACVTSLVKNQASAFITEGGKFILKSKTVVKEQVEENIDAISKSDLEVTVDKSQEEEGILYLDMTQGEDSNEDGISDSYTKMLCDGTILTGGGNTVFGNLTYEEVQSRDDLDADNLLNGQEVKLAQNKKGYVYAVLSSSPVLLDTDEDGIYDGDDTAPFTTGLEGGVVGSLRVIGHHDTSAIFMEGHAYLVYTSYINNQEVTVDDLYGAFYLNEEYQKLIAQDPYELLWSTTVSEKTDGNAAYREAVALDMWQEQPAGTEAITLDRGEYVSIGDYNMVTWGKAISDAFLNGESGTLMDYAAIQAIIEKITGKEIDVTYVMTHMAYLTSILSLESYIADKDVINGNTDGGIWFNREMESQKYQYNQYPNNVYEIDVTKEQVEDMLHFVEDNNYYSALSHNCSTVAVGAWNAAVGYERDANGDYVITDDGSYVENELFLEARGSGIFSIMDLPAVVSDNIIAISEKEETLPGKMLGELIVVKGADLKNTVNNQVHHFTKKASIEAVSNKTKRMDVSWSEAEGADGYEVSYSTTSDFAKEKKRRVEGKTSIGLKSLVGDTWYYVRVRAYVYNERGKRVYGEYFAQTKAKCIPKEAKTSK